MSATLVSRCGNNLFKGMEYVYTNVYKLREC